MKLLLSSLLSLREQGCVHAFNKYRLLSKALSVGCVLWVTVFYSVASFAKEQQVLECSVFNLEPYGYADDDGAIKGLAREAIEYIVRNAGYECEYSLQPYRRAAQAVSSGRSHLTIMFPNKLISSGATSLGVIDQVTILILTSTRNAPQSLDDLKNKSIATINSSQTAYKSLDSYPIDWVNINDFGQGLRLLEAQRVDGILGSEAALVHAAKTLNIDSAQFAKSLLISSMDVHFYLSNKYNGTGLERELSAAVEKYNASEYKNTLTEFYEGF